MNEEQLKNASLLILANKQDLPKAMNLHEITEKLELTQYSTRNWYAQPCCAKSGEGLF